MDSDTHLFALWLKAYLEKSDFRCKVSAPALASHVIRFLHGRKFERTTRHELERLLSEFFEAFDTTRGNGNLGSDIYHCVEHHVYDPMFMDLPMTFNETFTFRTTDGPRKTQPAGISRPVRICKARAQQRIHNSLEIKRRLVSTHRNFPESHMASALRRQNISFFELPKELRTMIYKEIIMSGGIARVISVTEPFAPKQPNEAKLPAMAQTCQFIRAEFFELLPQVYRLNTFIINLISRADARRACAWLDTTPASCHRNLTRLFMTSSIMWDGRIAIYRANRYRYEVNINHDGKVNHYHRSSWPPRSYTAHLDDGKKSCDKLRGLETNLEFFKGCVMRAASGRYEDVKESNRGAICRDFRQCGGEMDTG